MKIDRLLIYVWGLGSILFMSCGAVRNPIYSYEPKADAIEWKSGKKLAVLSNVDFELKVSLDHYVKGEIVFDVTVLNKSKFDQTLAPDLFYIVRDVHQSKAEVFDVKTMAVNPDEDLKNLSNKIDNFVFDQVKVEVVSCCLETSCNAMQAAICGKPTPKQQDEQRALRETNAKQRHEDANAELARWKSELEFKKTFMLRKATLHPGQQLGGKVYFRLATEDPFYDVYFPIGTTSLFVKFQKYLLTLSN